MSPNFPSCWLVTTWKQTAELGHKSQQIKSEYKETEQSLSKSEQRGKKFSEPFGKL